MVNPQPYRLSRWMVENDNCQIHAGGQGWTRSAKVFFGLVPHCWLLSGWTDPLLACTSNPRSTEESSYGVPSWQQVDRNDVGGRVSYPGYIMHEVPYSVLQMMVMLVKGLD